MTVASDIVVKFRSANVVATVVHDPVVGIVDTRWTLNDGWTCSCDELSCHHIAGAKSLITEESS